MEHSDHLENQFTRRGMLQSALLGGAASVAGIAGVDALGTSAIASELKKQQKRVILLWLAGGASQLETWDPKPGAVTGGPFRSIQTVAPGVRISELMPKMALRLKHTAIIRSLNTRNGDHGGAAQIMMRGRRNEANIRFPDLGAVVAREMGLPDSPVPDYVTFYTQTEGRGMAPGDSGFLGSRYAPMELTTDMMPRNIRKLDGISMMDHQARHQLRGALAAHFSKGRQDSVMNSHTEAFTRVAGLMSSEKLFDISQESESMRDRYGRTQFGEQCLIARRLVEAGVPFVRVGRAWWDSHGQNFETHQEMVPELDHVMATLIDDLKDRGLLEKTLIITLSEFGRTPSINASLGRDHFASAWSCSLTGAGVLGGSVYGETDESGNRVKDGEMNAATLFATIYSALGINPHKNYYIGSRPIPLVDAGTEPVKAVLA
ncbi:MAG: DUF1501 domain-containing protein [Zavarzinella sp.]